MYTANKINIAYICAGETMKLSQPFNVTLPSNVGTCTKYKLFMGCQGGNNCVIQYIGTVPFYGAAVANYSVSDGYATISTEFQGIRFTSLNSLESGKAFAKFPGVSNKNCGDSAVTGTWFAGANVMIPFLYAN
jgi:hypothetical protein